MRGERASSCATKRRDAGLSSRTQLVGLRQKARGAAALQ